MVWFIFIVALGEGVINRQTPTILLYLTWMAALTRSKGTETENTNDKESTDDSHQDINEYEDEAQSELKEEKEETILAEKCIEEFSTENKNPLQIKRRTRLSCFNVKTKLL